MYTIKKLVSASDGLKFYFPSNVFGLKCWPNAFQLDANNVNFLRGVQPTDRTCEQTENDRKFAKMIANMRGQTLSKLKELHLSLINLI